MREGWTSAASRVCRHHSGIGTNRPSSHPLWGVADLSLWPYFGATASLALDFPEWSVWCLRLASRLIGIPHVPAFLQSLQRRVRVARCCHDSHALALFRNPNFVR